MKIQIEKTRNGFQAQVETKKALTDKDLLRLALPALTFAMFGRISVRFLEAALRQLRDKRVFEIEGKKGAFVERGNEVLMVKWDAGVVELAEPPLGWHTTAAAIYSLVDALARNEADKKRVYNALIMGEVLKDNPDEAKFDGHFVIKDGDDAIKVLLPPDLEPWATLERAIEVLRKVRRRAVKCDFCGAIIPGRERVHERNFCSDLCRVKWHRQKAAARRPRP